MRTVHRLLERQLKRLGIGDQGPPTPEQWESLLRVLSQTYEQNDQDRYTLERSMSISSREMLELHDQLRAQSETELSRQAERLHQSLALVRATQEAAPDGVLAIDGAGRVIGFNQRFVDLWNVPRSQLEHARTEDLAARLADQLADADIGTLLSALLSVTSTEIGHGELERLDGRCYQWHSTPIRDGGRVYGRVAFFADITERKRAQQALRASAEELEGRVALRTAELEAIKVELEAVVSSTPHGLLTVVDGRVRWANAASEAMFGLPPGGLVGREPPVVTDCMSGVSKEATRGRLFELSRADGERLWVSVSCAAMGDPSRGPVAVLMVLEDVTERKQLEARMLAADRLASIGTLAAGVGHEINNPLAYVLANLIFLERELPTLVSPDASPAQKTELFEVLGEMREGAERVRDIVRELKAFSRQDELPMGPVELQRALQSAINMTKGEIRHRAQLVVLLEPLPAVLGVESKLAQVFLNLLVNAVQAIPPGEADRHQVTVKTRLEGNLAVAEVSDTGHGIAPEHLSRIFDPFFTTKPVGQGTGLGLSICLGIVQAFGGDLQVESALGRGTTFRVRLPLADAPRKPSPSRPLPTLMRSLEARLLLIDDEPALAGAVQRVLGATVTVVQALSAKAALERLAQGERYDVLLCDLMMPEMTGMELYQRLTQLDPELAERVLFMTGGASLPQVEAFLRTVTTPCLAKPLDFEGLRRELDALLARKPARPSSNQAALSWPPLSPPP